MSSPVAAPAPPSPPPPPQRRRWGANVAHQWQLAWEHDDEWRAPFPPPTTASEALGARWCAEACGIEIRLCTQRAKGCGAFATRSFASGEVVGVYWGEHLTAREYHVRHGDGLDENELTLEERREQISRRQQLARLKPQHPTHGSPMGGAQNGGAYCFEVRKETRVVSRLLGVTPPRRAAVVCIDGEDPARSSWCRYINDVRGDETPNLRQRIDSGRLLVWFEATRDIDAGEELCFEYMYTDSSAVGLGRLLLLLGTCAAAWLATERGWLGSSEWLALGAGAVVLFALVCETGFL